MASHRRPARDAFQESEDYFVEQHQFFNRPLSIKDFKVGTTLGTGTFGRVKQASLRGDPQQTTHALKILKKKTIAKLKQIDHIKSEKAILSKIQHPFIVQVKTTFQDEKHIYFLFQYVSGGELFSRLRKEGRFANDVALFYACEILMALQFLHKKGIVYRDLKPENLLIDHDGHIKLADFGFAKILENDRTFTKCGTPEYLAPEVVKGTTLTGYGKAVDWWSLGILLFEMLAGYPPFYDCKPDGIYEKILAGIIEFPRFFSLRTKDIIRKLLNPEVKYRLGTIDDASGHDIMNHKWFRGVDFKLIYRKKIPPPWIPELRDQADTACFENYPDSEDSGPGDDEDMANYDGLFNDF